MKKVSLFIVLALVMAVAALPWINGLIMEKLVFKAVANTNAVYSDTGADIRFEILEYHRGYARTRAEWKIDLGRLEPVYGVKEILFVEKAVHGFWGVEAETGLTQNPWFLKWTKSLGTNPLTISTRYSAFSPIQIQVVFDKSIVKIHDKPFKIGKLDLVVSVDKELTHISSKGKWEGFLEDENNKLESLRFESDQKRISNLVWQGNAALFIDRFMAKEKKEDLKVSNLSFFFDLAADKAGSYMDMDMKMRADNILFNGQDLSDWSLDAGISHMDIKAYEALYHQYSNLVNQTLAELSNPNLNEEDIGAVFGRAAAQSHSQFIAGVERMLKKDFEIHVSDLDIILPQGPVKGSLFLGLKKDMTMAGFFPLLAQPSKVLEIFSFKSRLSLPLSLTGKDPGLTTPVLKGMKTGFFVLNGTQLDHRAQIRENRLYMNGEEVVLK